MKKKDVFEQLADSMGEDERIAMLNEIKEDLKKHQKIESRDSDKQEKKEKEFKLLENEYNNSSFIEKIQLFIKKIITGKPIYSLMKEKHLKSLGKAVEHDYPGFVDIKESRIKEPFCNEVNLLKNSLNDIKEIFNVIENAGKADFYQFIAEHEMSELEKTLEKNTDPDFIMRTGKVNERDKIKNEIIQQYHEIIESVDSAEKEKVYVIIRGFFLIKQLILFNFDNFIRKFEFEPNGNKYSSFGNCRKNIRELYEILYNIKNSSAPFDTVLKYMVEYYYEKGDAAGKVSKDEYIGKMLKKIYSDFENINVFIKNTPLHNLIKYLYKDLHYEADKISGGEEWFSVYKNYLKIKIDKRFELFLCDQKKNDLLKKLRHYIETIPDDSALNFSIEIKERIFKLDYAKLFFYMKEMKNTFFQKKIDNIVSKILLDGVFYKDANKKELYESYNLINTIDSEFRDFMKRIDPESEEIKSIRKYNFEETSKKLQKKKIERFINDINSSLYEKYTEYYEAFISVSSVLYGIINGNVGGKYDTLSNAADICIEKTFMSFTAINTVNTNLREILKMFNELTEMYGMTCD